MNMLIDCFECGKKFSAAVNPCPHCGKPPYPHTCRLCEQRSKSSELVRGMHPTCLDSLKNNTRVGDFHDFNCPVCHSFLKYSDLSFVSYSHAAYSHHSQMFKASCPCCAHPLFTAECFHCKEAIFIGSASKVSVYHWYSDEWTRYREPREEIFHISCAALLEEKIKKKRVLSNQCTVCGDPIKPLKGLDKFFGKEPHKECSKFVIDIYELEVKNHASDYIRSFVERQR
jgi:hypothetical protein